MGDSATMLESGINSVAAAFVFRKAACLGIELTIRIAGCGMNHIIYIALPDGRKWTIRNARDWFELQSTLRRGTDEV